jgi:hypothetical protein
VRSAQALISLALSPPLQERNVAVAAPDADTGPALSLVPRSGSAVPPDAPTSRAGGLVAQGGARGRPSEREQESFFEIYETRQWASRGAHASPAWPTDVPRRRLVCDPQTGRSPMRSSRGVIVCMRTVTIKRFASAHARDSHRPDCPTLSFG